MRMLEGLKRLDDDGSTETVLEKPSRNSGAIDGPRVIAPSSGCCQAEANESSCWML